MTQARARLAHDDHEVLTVVGTFGTRDFPVERTWVGPPAVPAPHECAPRERGREVLLDTWQARIARGRAPEDLHGRPGSGSSASWYRLPEGPRMITAGDLAVLGDFLMLDLSDALGFRVSGNSLDNTLRVGTTCASEWVPLGSWRGNPAVHPRSENAICTSGPRGDTLPPVPPGGDDAMGPLSGLRVLDLSPTRVGAQVTQLLADFGAEVTWVEPPGGAELRRHPASVTWARGKRSIVLDLHDPTDREVARALAARADVLVESFRPGVAERLGLGPVELRAANPRLVYLSITGFGATGPYASLPGFEALVLAKLGVFHAFRRMTSGDAPPFVTTPFASFPASQHALHGILAALHERERSGEGQRIEVNLAHAFLSLDTWGWIEHVIAQRWPDAFHATETFDDAGRPASPFPLFLLTALTRDGRWLQFAAVAPHLFVALMQALGLEGLFADPEWEGLPLFGDDADKRAALWTRMLEAAREKTLAEWEAVFATDPNVYAEQYRGGSDILDHPQLLHDHLVLESVDAERGPVRQPAAQVGLARTPAEVRLDAPRLDEHREEILADLAAEGPTATQSDAAPEDRLPLEGVTVLELAVLFAAPFGATLLTDLGARVIKVEPLTGDPIRSIVTFPESGGVRVMQGKDSVCVDLATPEGLAIVHELAATADIVVQGFRAGVAARIGVDAATLTARNPDLIYVNAPGYGVDGPCGHRPSYAPSIGAAIGIALTNVGSSVAERADLDLDEVRDGSRRLSAAGNIVQAQADGFAALGVATATLLALHARDRVGVGQEVFTSMLRTGIHAMSAQAVTSAHGPAEPEVDGALRGFDAQQRVYDARTGWVCLAVPGDRHWDRFVAALRQVGAPVADLDDPRFADEAGRRAADAALVDVLAALFRTRTAVEWESILGAAGVGCVEVATTPIEAAVLDGWFGTADGYVTEVDHPTFDTIPRVAPYARFSRSATQALPGGLAGVATDRVLGELGRTAEAIADLRARGIVA